MGMAVVLALVAGSLAGAGPSPATAVAPAATQPVPEALIAACRAGQPYVVTAVLARSLDVAKLGQPAILAQRASSTSGPSLALARQSQVGAIWGLAFDWRRFLLYAAAYQKRGAGYGPGGPGAVYRVDLTSGQVTAFATLEAGKGGHDDRGILDQAAVQRVGRMGLGDIDLDADGTSLFVVNLLDNRIYRLSTADGHVLAVFQHGAAAEPWAASARAFGLAVRGSRVYHGVVDSYAGESGAPSAHVYSSLLDGTDLRAELALDLGYPRGALGWRPWHCPYHTNETTNCTEPMLADLDFTGDGRLILGLRDRQGDTGFVVGHGDLLPAWPAPGGWSVRTTPEFFEDRRTHDESFWGGFASLPGADQLAAAALSPERTTSGGLLWNNELTGRIEGATTLYAAGDPWFGKSQGLGDVEVLCPPDGAWWQTPTPVPSPTTPPSPTATATLRPTATPTPSLVPSPTAPPTATVYCPVARRPCPLYLPLAARLAHRCLPQHVDVALVVDVSTSMGRLSSAGRPKLAAAMEAVGQFLDVLELGSGGDQAAIVGFNDTFWLAQGLTDDRAALRRAMDGLANRMAEGTRLDLALAGGMAALADPAHRSDNPPVLVLLTDGLPNRVPTPPPAGSPEDTVRLMASAAKARGIQVYAIGLGRADAPDLNDRINVELLRDIASRPEQLFLAPDAEDLAGIYRDLAAAIPCAPGRTSPGAPTSAVPGAPTSAVPGAPTSAVPGAPTPAVPGAPTSAVPGRARRPALAPP